MSATEKVKKIEAVTVCDLSLKMSRQACIPQDCCFLEKRLNAVPTNAELSRLTNARRVMEITFTKNNTAAEIGDIIVRAFPSLAGKDLSG